MSAIIESKTTWLNTEFWDVLDRLESQHKRAQSDYERARRHLDQADPKIASEFHVAWVRYCEVIAELDRAAGKVELLRMNTT